MIKLKDLLKEASTPSGYDRAMKKMLSYMKGAAEKSAKKHNPKTYDNESWEYPTLLKKGSKFDKVVAVRASDPKKARSADFFVHRETGDIYKSASWSAPAKGARGNIFDSKTWKKYDVFGGWLYR